ncbi:MAG: MmcQ/YjbR family DNA-binding protein [Thermoleophilaceae bacterium]|nr:MmcQ/YjbR family DNA-binding protein [Thermoleophilaceae bacterium]
MRQTEKESRLERLSGVCLALPEATREDSGRHAAFRVRRRTFAYWLDDHHGDGIVGLVFKARWGEAEALAAAEPARFYTPAYLGPRGWAGLRLDGAEVNWTEVTDLVTESYALVAPKRLAALVGE